MRVWAVVSGEMHEGGTVTGVFSSRESAVAAALQTRCCFDREAERADPPSSPDSDAAGLKE